MAEAAELRYHANDITKCLVCLEELDSPRSLPCLHSFCLKCLEQNFEEKLPEDEVCCPVCRVDFRIPTKGLTGLMRDVFIESLVDAKRVSSSPSGGVSCDACLREGTGVTDSVSPATLYCTECQKKLCEQCSGSQKNCKAGTHTTKPLGAELNAELIQLYGQYCEIHKDRGVELYCFDCRTNICTTCSAAEHKEHKWQELGKVAEDFRPKIDNDVTHVASRITDVLAEVDQLESEKEKFLSQLDEVAQDVLQKGEEIKRLVESQVNKLLQEVQTVKANTVKEIDLCKERLDLALVAMESFKTYSLAVKTRGKPSDITRAGDVLHFRADELLQKYVTQGSYWAPYVTFVPTDTSGLWSPLQRKASMVGSLSVKKFTETRILHTLPAGEPILGITQLDSELFLLRVKQTEQVEVYYVNCFVLKRCLSVPGITSFLDMAACERNRCLYICDCDAECVHRLERQGNTTPWSVYDKPWGLSVTAGFNVLVTCDEVRRLKEFSTWGDWIRQVQLQPDVVDPWHSVLLANGQFVVSHGADPINRVCVVDAAGRTLLTYGGQRGSEAGQIDGPAHLAVDNEQFIFVADVNNRRVLLLSPKLKHVRDVVSRDSGLQGQPWNLFANTPGRRLYVADNEWKDYELVAGRLIVLNL